jgi:hypothetical protein
MFSSIKMTPNAYAILYVDMQYPEDSDILGVYASKDSAVKNLISRACYQVTSSGKFVQFGNSQTKYNTYDELYKVIDTNMRLFDSNVDRYTIIPITISE